MDSTRLVHLFWIPLLVYLVWFLERFAWFDGIASIANDSVNYLVMARHYSPWTGESPAIATAWQYEDFPPLFPMLLAYSGAAYSFYWSHVMVTVTGLLSLILLYYLVLRRTHSSVLASALPALVILMPGFLFALQGILSETLYLLLSLLAIVAYGRGKVSYYRIIVLGCLVAMALLTRTVGFSLWMALGIVLAIRLLKGKSGAREVIVMLLMPLVFYYVVITLWGAEADSHYPGVLQRSFAGDESLVTVLATNFSGMFDAWRTFWQIYWHDGLWVQNLFVTGIGIVSLVSAVYLIIRQPEDLVAWYVLAYLSILALWPHPGQMVRLVMPIVPLMLVLVLQVIATMGLGAVLNSHRKWLFGMVLVSMGVVIVPAHGYLNERIDHALSRNMQPMSDYLRILSYEEAWKDLVIQQQMIDDFASLRTIVQPDVRLLYYVPAYTALLSDVNTTRLDLNADASRMREQISNSGAEYLLLTYYHPREKRSNANALVSSHFEDITQELACSHREGIKVSCLYRIVR